MNKKTHFLAHTGIIAALYITLTLISAAFGLSSGVIQVRISEALCILPIFTSAAIPGVTVGCLLSNIICGGTVFDIVFGTIATFIGAVLASLFKKKPYLSSIPTVISNAVIIPVVLLLSGVGEWNMFPYFALTVGIGEVISCSLFGSGLILYLKKRPGVSGAIFNDNITKPKKR